jgi:hypothetical protein
MPIYDNFSGDLNFTAGLGSLQVTGGALRGVSGDCLGPRVEGSFPANQYAQGACQFDGGASRSMIGVRVQAGGEGYYVGIEGGEVKLWRYDGSWNELATTSGLGLFGYYSYTLKVEISGTSFSVWRDSNFELTTSDSYYSTGKPGAGFRGGSTMPLDDFECTSNLATQGGRLLLGAG